MSKKVEEVVEEVVETVEEPKDSKVKVIVTKARENKVLKKAKNLAILAAIGTLGYVVGKKSSSKNNSEPADVSTSEDGDFDVTDF